jgi:hypothetical protein
MSFESGCLCGQIRHSVDLRVGIGLTNSAPKYSVILAGAYRFGASRR